MASYFRSMFGGQPSNTSQSESKAYKRSQSAPSTSAYGQNLNYIYAAPPGTTPSTSSSRTGRDRNCSYAARTNTPSPLRYTSYDSGSVRSNAHSPYSPAVPRIPSSVSQTKPQQKPVRVPMYRTSSNIPGDRHAVPYPIYSHGASLSNVHSTSSSSMYPGSSASGHRPAPPRSSSSGSVTPSEARSALKQSSTWNSSTKSTSGPHPHVSFMNPKRTSALHMHPLFAYSRLSRPPISYDVLYTPSSRTVVDRSTRSAIPAHTLAQPATDPPTLGRLVLKSSKFPWPIVVSSTSAGSSKSGSRFYVAGSSSSSSSSGNAASPVTNLDVLYALHNTMQTRVTQQEWEALGHGSRAQRKITRAYEKRCITLGGGWDGGVRRIDYLGEKTRLVGVEVDKTADGGVGKLVFSHA